MRVCRLVKCIIALIRVMVFEPIYLEQVGSYMSTSLRRELIFYKLSISLFTKWDGSMEISSISTFFRAGLHWSSRIVS